DLYLASVAAGVEGGMCKMAKLEVPIHRHPQYHRSASTLRGVLVILALGARLL
ncbi:hypothetical protein L211DRAFT_832793, partial [Terfezia boudieri ATCC MYA-4762]